MSAVFPPKPWWQARAAYMARRGADFGVVIDGPITVDMKQVKARKDGVVQQSNQGVTNWLKNMDNLTVYEGHGRFESPTSVRVNGDVLEAERIILNVGARAFVPDMDGLSDVSYLTNSSVMEVDFLPEHLVIIGGSYIGLEFAQIYRRFGSRVTVVEKGERLIARDDEDVSAAVKEIVENEGVEVRLEANCLAVEKRGEGVAVNLTCDEGPNEVEGSHLLLAVGRVPNTDDLGVDKAGLEMNGRGFIPVDDQLQTNVPGIWAIGDVNGLGAFTHTSYNDYEILAANLFDSDPRRVSDRIVAYGLYIDPPLGRVGLTEQQVREVRTQSTDLQDGDAAGGAGARTQRNPRLHEDGDRRGDQADPRRRDSRYRRRRDHSFGAGRDVRRRTLHRDRARDAHPPDRHRNDPDDAG